jgi:hypothetical protein
MYSLVRLLPASRLLLEQLPALLVAFVIAELFYKFKSFTLETLAFLVTWAVVDAAIQLGRHLVARPRPPAIEPTRR